MTTPTARTLERLRKLGYTAEVVEKRLPIPAEDGRPVHVTRDLFGCIDVLAVKGAETLGVQATSAGNVSARVAKARALLALKKWLAGGARKFAVWGWERRQGKWEPRVVELASEDLAAVLVSGRRRRRPQKHEQRDLFAGEGTP